jgi:hypothetical protein
MTISPERQRGRGQGAGGASPSSLRGAKRSMGTFAERLVEKPRPSRTLLLGRNLSFRPSLPPCSLLPAQEPLVTKAFFFNSLLERIQVYLSRV